MSPVSKTQLVSCTVMATLTQSCISFDERKDIGCQQTHSIGFGSLGQISVPKWVQYRDLNLYLWKHFCIVKCTYQGNSPCRESSPYPSLLVEMSLSGKKKSVNRFYFVQRAACLGFCVSRPAFYFIALCCNYAAG